VRHPNAVSVLDFGITQTGVAYLIMELLEGRSLADELKERGTLTAFRCSTILDPICDVLSEVHAQGMVHRDIKPANIFIHRGHTGEIVKVLDFGIAKLVGDVTGEEHLTVEGSILGTPTYMAPERFSNENYDGRADVYSLGILLYRMLGGRTPFQSKDLMTVAMQHLRETPRPLRELNPMVTPQVEAVVMAAMSKSMDHRPSASELARRLRLAAGRRAADVRSAPIVPAAFDPPLPPLPRPPEPDESSEPTHVIEGPARSDSPLAEEDRNPMRRLLDKLFDSEN
jgi:serine/threonine protein kinase